ncbi:hypothetical protein [Candidatus Nitrotoga sp. M5]|uniref:hypothetical protein n=1 Tax=Candidatus Nitrotoga sp. M5 TaxID=2890409 RepID=UPI001EF41E83|nr:hypothetical protein [Candidatus Nitrotoga sp. M5]CAH1387845.1 Exonuclease SbcC [Candidatus Nitrotoga sp. M5]
MTNRLYDIEDIIESLKQQKDEIKLQIHLAKAEARDEWPELEKKCKELMSKTDALRKEASDVSGDVIKAAKVVADEIKRGFDRIQKLM